MRIDESWYQKPTEAIKQRTGAGGIIVRKDAANKIWLALTTGESEKNTTAYVLPKGGVDSGEEIEEAARREIEEEAGFSALQLIEKLGVRERLNFEKKRWSTVHYFLYQTDETDPKPTDPHYPYRTDWFDLAEPLPPMFWPEQQKLVEEAIPKIRVHFGLPL
jgi:8-oxo-dGTP pyrophosphatase MutT (NUDIX family)